MFVNLDFRPTRSLVQTSQRTLHASLGQLSSRARSDHSRQGDSIHLTDVERGAKGRQFPTPSDDYLENCKQKKHNMSVS